MRVDMSNNFHPWPC